MHISWIMEKGCICLVFKKRNINNINDYRPISLMCNFAKIFESIRFKHSCVKASISPPQHGFMEKRSTFLNLACFGEYVSKALYSKYQIDVIYTDFRKAFDQIDHYIVEQIKNIWHLWFFTYVFKILSKWQGAKCKISKLFIQLIYFYFWSSTGI